MNSYICVEFQQDMNQLLDSIMISVALQKEIHLVNRTFVRDDDKNIVVANSSPGFDAQILIQSQWEPFAIELLFIGIHLPNSLSATQTGIGELQATLN